MFDLIKRLFAPDPMFGGIRHPQWRKVRADFIKQFPNCAVCQTTTDCEVHHIRPAHLFPADELNPRNLITLCRPHHLEWGHYGSFYSYNENIKNDAEIWRERVKERP